MNLALRMLPITLIALLPIVASAQSAQPTDEMHAAIMTQLLHDPRAAQMPPEELQKLVDALAQKATAQDVAPTDIMLQQAAYTGATETVAESVPSDCDGGFSGSCMMSEALGFIGENPTLPLYFLVTSGLLILLIVRMKKHHHAMGHFDDPKPVSTPTGPVI